MQNFFKIKRRKGFTMLELVIVLAVTALMALAATPIYTNFLGSSQLEEIENRIVITLRNARDLSVSGYENSSYGVYFEVNPSAADNIVMFKGDSYTTRDTDFDRVVSLDNAVVLSTTLSDDQVVFSKFRGVPSSTGEVTLIVGDQGSRTVTINSLGMVSP